MKGIEHYYVHYVSILQMAAKEIVRLITSLIGATNEVNLCSIWILNFISLKCLICIYSQSNILFHFMNYSSIKELKLEGMRDVIDIETSEQRDCPEGSFINGFDIAYHPLLGMTAISAECADKHGNTIR